MLPALQTSVTLLIALNLWPVADKDDKSRAWRTGLANSLVLISVLKKWIFGLPNRSQDVSLSLTPRFTMSAINYSVQEEPDSLAT